MESRPRGEFFNGRAGIQAVMGKEKGGAGVCVGVRWGRWGMAFRMPDLAAGGGPGGKLGG